MTLDHKDKFKNKDGTITGYSFMCGYVEVYGDWLHGNGVHLSIDGDSYHVKGFGTWETFQLVKEARKFARKFGTLNKGDVA